MPKAAIFWEKPAKCGGWNVVALRAFAQRLGNFSQRGKVLSAGEWVKQMSFTGSSAYLMKPDLFLSPSINPLSYQGRRVIGLTLTRDGKHSLVLSAAL